MTAYIPAPKVLVRSAVAVVAIAAPIAVVWWLIGERTAMAAWLGITAMFIAITRLPIPRQIVIGLWAGAAAGAGVLVQGHALLLGAVVVLASLAQWRFNQWSITSGALLPPLAFYYWAQAAEQQSAAGPLHVVSATWLGAAIAIGIGAVAGLGGAARPAGRDDALWHAIGLAAGCVIVVTVVTVFDLPRGFWAILTLCLVYRPTHEETARKVWQRTLGTVIGGVLAVILAMFVPQAAVIALAMVGAVLAVAYILTNDYLRYAVSLTVTIVLLFSAGEPVLDLAEERAGMTILGAVIAVALTGLITRTLGRWKPSRTS